MQECLECGSRLREADGFCPGCGLRIHKHSSFSDHENDWDEEDGEYKGGEENEGYGEDNWTREDGWRDAGKRDELEESVPGRRDEDEEWHRERRPKYRSDEVERHRGRVRRHRDEDEDWREKRGWRDEDGEEDREEELSRKFDRGRERHGKKKCPGCNSPLVLVEEYGELWCDTCEKYPLVRSRSKEKDRERKKSPKSPDHLDMDHHPRSKSCPHCEAQLIMVEDYGELWCDTCEKYPFVVRRDKDKDMKKDMGKERDVEEEEEEDRKEDRRVDREKDRRVDRKEDRRVDGKEDWRVDRKEDREKDKEMDELAPLPDIPDSDNDRRGGKEEEKCPECATPLILAEEFHELWCDKCNKYPLIKRRPRDEDISESELPDSVRGPVKRKTRPQKSKGFERLITISIVLLAVFAAIFAYQDIVLKEKAKQQHLSGQESIIRREAFVMISEDEVGLLFEFIRQAQLFMNMSDDYITQAANLFRYGQYGSPLYNDYINESMHYYNAALISKGSFVQMMGMTFGYEYTDYDPEVDYQSAVEDFFDLKDEYKDIEKMKTEEAKGHFGNETDLDDKSDRYGYGTIILSIGTLIAGLSLLPDRKGFGYFIYMVSLLLFFCGMFLGVTTYIGGML